MKTIIILLMLSVANIAHADEWSTESKALASIFTVATVIDWGQTRDIVHNSTDRCTKRINNGLQCTGGYHEKTNIYLGRDPSMSKVNTYMPVAMVAILGIAHVLPEKYRVRFLQGMSFLELGTIYNNKKIGLKIRF